MISIVIPLYNEEQNLIELYTRIQTVFAKLKRMYEIIFIDDGSTDGSLMVLKKLANKDKKINIFSFRKNQGKAEALTLGFQMSRGDKIITLDADLQDRPEEIGKLIHKIDEGYDLISGWRRNRRDSVQKVLSSRVFNKIVGIFWGTSLHDYNCGLKIYSSSVAKRLHLYGGMHRFIPVLASQLGYKVSELPVEHDRRLHGKSKYSFSKIWKELPDMFTMVFLLKYSKRPLHFFGNVGGIMFLIGSGILLYLSVLHFLGQAIGERPLLFFGGLFVLGGLQIFFTGFLADLIINVSYGRSVSDTEQYRNLRYTTDTEIKKLLH